MPLGITNSLGFDLTFSGQHLKPALLISLLTVWVLVLVFAYLDRYTRRRYFTIWTAAWLFYALWLTMGFVLQMHPETGWLLMLKQWCISVSAMFLLWGSLRFLGEPVRQRLIGLTLLFLLFWSYLGVYHLHTLLLEVQIPIFCLIGLASLMASYSFYVYRRSREFLGATLLAIGFFFWSFYIAAYPLLQDEHWVAAGYIIAAVLQLLIAVSMIILVLEQIRFQHQRRAKRQISNYKSQNDLLETKVISTEERYRYLFEQAGEAIVITGEHDLRILELNQAGERLLGLSRGKASQQSLTGFCRVKARSDKLPSSGEDWFQLICRERPLYLVHQDGALIPAEAVGAPVEYDGQRGYQFFFRELTDRSRLEQQLRQSEKLASLGQMISGVAHEMNNPLAVVKGYLELILGHHELPDKTRRDLEKVARESNRAARLVQNFLVYAREQPADREMVDVNDLIRGVIELRKFEFSVNNAELRLDLAERLPQISASPDQIQQLLIILLNNSLQAMLDLSGHKQIHIRSALLQGKIGVIVEDSGPGVAAEIEPRIFEPFFTTKGLGAGTGLGLSIAHSIMSRHQGQIRYERSAKGGASFIVEFPINPLKLPESAPTVPPARAANAGQPSAPRTENILVVDDEKPIVEMIGEMLSVLGYTPALCTSAAEALALIDHTDFDLVLSDIRMPGIDGQEFYRLASSKKLVLSQKFVFLTGDTINKETKAFLEKVGTPHIAKPFHFARIEEALNQMLRPVPSPSPR